VAQNATGILAGKDHCVCEVLLPDSSFPAKRVGALEDETIRLSNRVEDEMQKLEEQDIILDTYSEKIINLTRRVEYLEKLHPESLVEISFEVLKREIRELEMYISAMRVKPNGNSVQVETLYNENLKAKPSLMVPLGSCQHQGLAHISKPNLMQLNWKGNAYKSGAWGKDAAWNTTKKSLYWVAPLNTDGRVLESIRIYPSMSDLQMYKNPIDLPLSRLIKNKLNNTFAGQGAGVVVHNNNLYYNCFNSHDMCRASLTSGVYQKKPLLNALFNNRFSYAGTMFQDMDFSSDEKGLWVIFTTEKSAGKIVVGKVNVATFTVDNIWITTQNKSDASNAFMICGVLYVTRSLGPKMEEVFYMFDTKTGKEGHLSIMMEKMAEKVHSLSYNSNDRKLYMFSEGYLLHYDIALKP
ncbi:hypothetical protein AB205_0100570, partial [Aquarana catesbeiana]